MGEPSTTPCQVCGLGPTRVETIRRHVGLFVMQRFVKLQEPFCRTHGSSITAKYLGRTLLQGWWGFISFFVNWFDVVNDIVVWFRYRSLPEPTGTPLLAGSMGLDSPSWTPRPDPVIQVSAFVQPVAAPVPSPAPVAQPGWYPDPAGRFEHRWHDGHTWTRNAARGGQNYDDPLD